MFQVDIEMFSSQNYVDFQSEASTCGIPPGYWPPEIEVQDSELRYTANLMHLAESDDQETLYAVYESRDGARFRIYSD